MAFLQAATQSDIKDHGELHGKRIPVAVECWFTAKGVMMPLKFKIRNEDESLTLIEIKKILYQDSGIFSGEKARIFNCSVINNSRIMTIKLIFYLEHCSWFVIM